jgi:disulfide bond formation protein DsbB
MPNLDTDYRDKTSPVWDMSQERLLTEQILVQRFNFFLVLFAVIMAGAINAKTQIHMQLLLTAGALLAIVFTKALHRTSRRLDCILDFLKQDPSHPFTIVSREVGGEGIRRTLWRSLPTSCTVVICIAAVASWVNLLQVASIACPK